MDHEVVVREKMTERYLLNELDPDTRDRFEEHYFVCPECAVDVGAAAELVAHSKIVLAETAETAPASAAISEPDSSRSGSSSGGWFAWLRPALAVPVIALLLAVIGYQNFVTYPQLQSALKQPQVLPWAQVNVATYGAADSASEPTISLAKGNGFLLFVRIPPDKTYERYIADFYDPAGKLAWSLPIPAATGQDLWSIQIPAANREAGSYTLAVRGFTSAGTSNEVGRASFELQIQK